MTEGYLKDHVDAILQMQATGASIQAIAVALHAMGVRSANSRFWSPDCYLSSPHHELARIGCMVRYVLKQHGRLGGKAKPSPLWFHEWQAA